MVEGAYGFFHRRIAVWAMGVDNVDVRELETFKGKVGAFDDVFARETDIVYFVARFGKGRVGGSPVYLSGVRLRKRLI